MKVQDLIDLLSKVEDKTLPVVISIESGMGCLSTSTDVEGNETEIPDEDNEEGERTVFLITGEETSFE